MRSELRSSAAVKRCNGGMDSGNDGEEEGGDWMGLEEEDGGASCNGVRVGSLGRYSGDH